MKTSHIKFRFSTRNHVSYNFTASGIKRHITFVVVCRDLNIARSFLWLVQFSWRYKSNNWKIILKNWPLNSFYIKKTKEVQKTISIIMKSYNCISWFFFIIMFVDCERGFLLAFRRSGNIIFPNTIFSQSFGYNSEDERMIDRQCSCQLGLELRRRSDCTYLKIEVRIIDNRFDSCGRSMTDRKGNETIVF